MKIRILLSRFRAWLKNIPVEDPINRQVALLLQLILLGLISIIVFAIIVNLLLVSQTYTWQEIIMQNVIAIIMFALPLFLLRTGYFRSAVTSIIALIFLLLINLLAGNDFQDLIGTLTFLTLAILLAGLLMGRSALIVTFTASAAFVISPILREQNPALRLEYIGIAGNFILMNGLISIFINSFGVTLRNSLQAALQREKEIKKLNEQLQKQVAELERFAYTVSHELKSPLVTIKNYTESVDRDLQDGKYERARMDFSRITNATDMMHETIQDLLELSRIGRIVNPPEAIDTVQLVRDALERTDASLRSKNVTVVIAENLPNFHGDRVRLREVFENLIGNAVKYMGDQLHPTIEIGARNGKDQQVFFVKDNGMGIDPQYHTRIFNLFEKLNPSIEGTGIGLALVKRIVEYHGGDIWVESEGLGKGSVFCFTIPNHKEQPKE